IWKWNLVQKNQFINPGDFYATLVPATISRNKINDRSQWLGQPKQNFTECQCHHEQRYRYP
ncbi:hypothetical protein, partial [Brevibacillus gelatini]|uniref:hypothetical protein n=1 Tax=Brevibacillus gelatini TaxID=1655277 RepID=UPI001B86350F